MCCLAVRNPAQQCQQPVQSYKRGQDFDYPSIVSDFAQSLRQSLATPSQTPVNQSSTQSQMDVREVMDRFEANTDNNHRRIMELGAMFNGGNRETLQMVQSTMTNVVTALNPRGSATSSSSVAPPSTVATRYSLTEGVAKLRATLSDACVNNKYMTMELPELVDAGLLFAENPDLDARCANASRMVKINLILAEIL